MMRTDAPKDLAGRGVENCQGYQHCVFVNHTATDPVASADCMVDENVLSGY